KQVLISGLLSAISSGNWNAKILDDWATDVVGLVIENGLLSWLADAREILALGGEEATKIAKSMDEQPERRVLASVKMSADSTLDAHDLFYGHITLLNFFASSVVR